MSSENTSTSEAKSSSVSRFPNTLREYLLHYHLAFTVANRFPTSKTSEKKSTDSHIKAEKLEKWKDFKSITFNNDYLKENLDYGLETEPELQNALTPPLNLLAEELFVLDELSFRSLVKASISHVDKDPEVISMVGSYARILLRRRPDWCTLRRRKPNSTEQQSLLPGDTKFEHLWGPIPWGNMWRATSPETPTGKGRVPVNSLFISPTPFIVHISKQPTYNRDLRFLAY
ncbi:hypothetical protein DL98DRAFT_599825 [Cadophora sp. DSE1049]|nr:hypothetical protein DL98DRAFT_599825 [Cadophora sp. DSE1049]